MVNLHNRFFFVIISDFFKRKEIIENLVKKILQGSSTTLNISVLYSKEINLEFLKSKVFSNSFDNKKILIFKEASELSKEIKDFFLKNLKNIISNNYFIFETEKNYFEFVSDKKFGKDKFFNFLLKNSTVLKSNKFNYDNLFFDFKKYIRAYDIAGALYILEELFRQYPNSEKLWRQILGILVLEFSSVPNISKREYYLEKLFELDRRLKEKNFDYKVAIEQTLTTLLYS